MELNQTRIEDGIIREVSDNLIGDDELLSRVKKAVDTRIDGIFKTVADTQIATAVSAAIAQGFEHEYARVNSFGEKEGKPTTIRKELERVIAGYWNQKVDRNGKSSDSSYSGEMTRAEWTMLQLVAADFKGEMKQHIVNLGGSLKDALRAELHTTVNHLLSEVFHVNSADDQATKGHGRSVIDPAVKPIS